MSRVQSFRSYSSKVWNPVLDGLSFLWIGLAYAVFASFMVAYHYMLEYAMPSTVMFIFMTAGLTMGYTWGLYRIDHTRLDVTAFSTGLLSVVAILFANWIITATIPMSGIAIETSPFYVMLFYASVGVAEEILMTVFLFGLLVSMGTNWLLAVTAKTLLFVAYHNTVAQITFGMQIFKVTPYSLVLYVGSFILTSMYYLTQRASVPITGHAVLNAVVTAINVGVIVR